MPALVCFGFLNQADVNSVCFGWVCSSRLGEMLLSFVSETTESGPSLPFICDSCARSRELFSADGRRFVGMRLARGPSAPQHNKQKSEAPAKAKACSAGMKRELLNVPWAPKPGSSLSCFPFYSWKCYFCLFPISKKFQLRWSCWLLCPPTHTIFFNLPSAARLGRVLPVPLG